MKIKLLACLAVLVLAGGALPATAVPIVAYDVPAGQAGNQGWTGGLGMDFDVITAITVSSLGVFASPSEHGGGPDINNSGLFAQIFSLTGAPMSEVLSFTSGSSGTALGGSLFKDLTTPLTLLPGSYSIVAWGYDDAERNGNLGCNGDLCGFGNDISGSTTDDGGGLIAFVGGARYSDPGVTGVLPDHIDGGPANRYYAGTFTYEVAAVPEPGSLILLGSGLLGLGVRSRRKGPRA